MNSEIYKIFKVLSYVAQLEYFKSAGLLNENLTNNSLIRSLIENNSKKTKDMNNELRSRIEELPQCIQYSIFRLLDYCSLTKYAIAFAKYLPFIIQPVYWKNISININNDTFKLDEIDLLISHLNKHLKAICLSLKNDKNTTKIAINIFKNCTNLSRLTVNLTLTDKVVATMCSQLKYLKYLDITSPNLCDNCLILFSDSFKHLDSLVIQSNMIISFGLAYFLLKTKYLKSFGYILPDTSDSVFRILFEKHRRTIEKLKLGLHNRKLDDSIIEKLNEFPKIYDLYLFNFKYNEETLAIIDDIKGLISLSLSLKPEDALRSLFETIPFKKQKMTVKKLCLGSLLMSKYALLFIGYSFPNLETLIFDDALVNGDFVADLCKNLKSLKYLLMYRSTFDNTNFTFALTKHIKNFVNKDFKLVYLKTYSDKMYSREIIQSRLFDINTQNQVPSVIEIDNCLQLNNISNPF